MSILQDLDPQYAKIHTHSTPTRRYAVILLGLLLSTGGGYWVLTQYLVQPGAANELHAGRPGDLADKTEQLAQTKPESSSADQPKIKQNPEAMTPANSSGATIRDDGQSSPQLGQAVSTPPGISFSENAKNSLADTEYRRQSPASNHAKAVPSNGLMKGERKNTTVRAMAKTEKNQAPAGKRPVERDVDIISAIVR
ncbi:MAG: hypothetical protein JNM16_03620 [Dechloromonas sp.]|nr:hypothetical protein [Dechloromonas sp.]MBV2193729.1 hypothetical protein [Azonexus sp.]